MTLLAADPSDLPSPSASPMPSPMALLSRRSASSTSSLFRPWAASEAAGEAAGEATEALVQCSPPVGICAGLSSRAGRPNKPRSSPVAPSTPPGPGPKAQPHSASGQQPILIRLEGLVATLDESSRSSRSSSSGSSRSRSSKGVSSGNSCGGSSDGSCPASPARDLRITKNNRPSSSSTASSANGRKLSRSAFSAPKHPKSLTPPADSAPSSAPSLVAGGMLSLSPEEVAMLAAQQQAFHEEALLAMAGLLPPPGVAPPGVPPGALLPPEGLPAVYLDEYARLLQQEQKAQNMTARKQRPKKYRCPHCQVAFSNNGQLRGHVRIHTGERPFKCEEESCGKRFTRNEELTRHKRIHSGLRPFACQACGKRFGRKDHLKKHTRTHDPAHRMAQMLPMLPPPHYLYGF